MESDHHCYSKMPETNRHLSFWCLKRQTFVWHKHKSVSNRPLSKMDTCLIQTPTFVCLISEMDTAICPVHTFSWNRHLSEANIRLIQTHLMSEIGTAIYRFVVWGKQTHFLGQIMYSKLQIYKQYSVAISLPVSKWICNVGGRVPSWDNQKAQSQKKNYWSLCL